MSDITSPTAQQLADLHDALVIVEGWPLSQPAAEPTGLWDWIRANHRFNALLWREEDQARRTRVSDAQIVANKRAIDRYNQARNDAVERIDEVLLVGLGLMEAGSAAGHAPRYRVAPDAFLNSETAGSMIDRMSILALKIHALRIHADRADVSPASIEESRARARQLAQQRTDLGACLDRLLADAQRGAAYFKVYRQFKMYNDRAYNPELLAERSPDV